MKLQHRLLLTAAALALSCFTHPALAALPSGTLQVNVTDVTNLLWDVSSIGELQDLDFDISDEGTEISFAAPFVQTGAGKLVGFGVTQMEVTSPVFVGHIDNAAYKVSGSITSAKGVARLTFTGIAKGLAEANGRIGMLTGSLAAKVTIDANQQAVSGTYTAMGSATGVGSIKETGSADITWTDAVNAMGDGSWTLAMDLTNDAVKKIGGTARVTLSSGAFLDFTVKGTYKSTTDTSILILAATPESKGSTLKVTLTGSTISSIQGKVTGQTIKRKL